MINRAVIEKLHFPVDGYLYNVRIETSVDGNLFVYCGNGKYFKTKAEAEAYKKEVEAGQEQPAQQPKKALKDGFYYQFDCMNAFVNDGLYNANEWTQEEAIKTASDYEATLILYKVEAGQIVEKTVIYDPFDCME